MGIRVLLCMVGAEKIKVMEYLEDPKFCAVEETPKEDLWLSLLVIAH